MRPHGDVTDDGSDRFTDFMTQCTHRLYRVAYLLTGDRGQAEELTQSALVRTYTAWHRIRRGDGYGYARRILVNLHNDWWRGRLRWERPAAHPPDRSVGGDPATVVVQRQQVAAALQRLTRRERTVIVCRYFLDLSEQQTADELNVAVGTVKSVTARALAKLRIAPDLNPDAAVGDPPTEGAA
jgi:RNA polymerase sigma-70 factor (sigma-E family)